ncbi:MAG: helix-turn-helix transcriptional regulator [Pseudomonadota bacterium]
MKTIASEAINEFLKETRRSAVSLANEIGVTEGEISRWRKGKVEPAPASIEKLKQVIPHEYFNKSKDLVSASRRAGASQIADTYDLTRRFYSLNTDPHYNDTINIVTASSALHSRFADRTARNFIFMDNYSDRDSLLQVSLDLARSSPGVEVVVSTSDAFEERNLDKNIVLVGGPSIHDGEPNNLALDTVLRHSEIPIWFSDNAIHIGEKTYAFEISDDGIVLKDWACVLRIRSPFSADRYIVAIFGHFTWGGRAAAESLSTRRLRPASLLHLLERRGLLEREFLAVMPARPQLAKVVYDIANVEIFEIDENELHFD